MKKLIIIVFAFCNCCITHVVVEQHGLIIEKKNKMMNSIFTLQTEYSDQGFGYISKNCQNDSILEQTKGKDNFNKMGVKLLRRAYCADGFIPIPDLEYSVLDTTIISIDTIFQNPDPMLPDLGTIIFKIKKDGNTELIGKNKYVTLKADIRIENGILQPTGFPKKEYKHKSIGNCKCKS